MFFLQKKKEKKIFNFFTWVDSDIELFEDDPIEYIRRDLEGSDTETRRRAASDLVRGLLEHFAKEVTELCSAYVQEYLQASCCYLIELYNFYIKIIEL